MSVDDEPGRMSVDGIDVSDLFDAFHRVAACVWREFGRDADGDQDGVSFDELIDQLEVDMFLPACARRARETLGIRVDPDEIGAHIALVDASGSAVSGGAGRYHSHAFHPLDPRGEVPDDVLAGNLLPRSRREVALLLLREPPARARTAGRRQLPVR
ncbi:MAG TPA: hypothetical protein VK939_03515 [Longimicrobiales bacterium]|nr:hypothetical protein [Longimicrobiales bacterium]